MSTKRKAVSLAIAGIVAAGFIVFQQSGKQENTAVAPENEEQNPATSANREKTVEDPSPFAVVESEVPEEEPETAAAKAENVAPVEPTETTGSQDSPAALVVPSSYPIEDAEKYFIPKDQRGPGNIGGPPPLDFPGGPNDKSQQSDEG